MPRGQAHPYAVLAVGLFAVSTASTFIRFAQANGAPSLVIAAVRLTLASLILAPFALRRYHQAIRQLSRRDWMLVLLSGALLAAHFASWITSLEHVSVLVSVVLVTTSPLWVALFAPLLLRESLDRRTMIGIGVAFAGGLLISLTGDNGAARPDGLALLGSLLAVLGAIAAAFYLIIGRHMRATLDLLPYITLVYGTAAVLLLITVLAAGLPLTGYTTDTYFWMLLLAVLPQLVGHSSFNYALGHLSAAFVSLVILTEPAGSALLAMIFLQEMPGEIQVLGSAIVLFGVGFAQRAEASSAGAIARTDRELPGD